MKSITVFVVCLMTASCASYNSLSPGTDASKGVWVSKKTTFFGLQIGDEEVRYYQPKEDTKHSYGIYEVIE